MVRVEDRQCRFKAYDRRAVFDHLFDDLSIFEKGDDCSSVHFPFIDADTDYFRIVRDAPDALAVLLCGYDTGGRSPVAGIGIRVICAVFAGKVPYFSVQLLMVVLHSVVHQSY